MAEPLTCRDRNCDPDKGDEGCMAAICNEGAHDGLDGVWISAWDSCPLIAISSAQHAEARAEDDAWLAWVETVQNGGREVARQGVGE